MDKLKQPNKLIEITTYPDYKNLTLTEAKNHLRVLHSNEDTIIGNYVDAAQVICFNETSHAPTEMTITVKAEEWATLEIPVYPLNSVSSVQYYDTDNNIQTLNSANWKLFNSFPYEVEFYNTLPSLYDRPDAIVVTAAIGYADDSCPEDVKQALRFIVGDLYEFRQSQAVGASAYNLSRTTEWLLGQISYRDHTF